MSGAPGLDAEREMLRPREAGPVVVRSSAAVPTPVARIGIVTERR